MYLRLVIFVLVPCAAGAQQVDPGRLTAAVPTLVEQREAALNALALCTGDNKLLQKKLDEALAKEKPFEEKK